MLKDTTIYQDKVRLQLKYIDRKVVVEATCLPDTIRNDIELNRTKAETSAYWANWLTELVERDLRKGTRYWGAEGKLWSEENPDAYAGVHNMDGMMVIFDEASGIPDSIWSVAAGFFTENILDRYWLAFSNGRRNTGYFYEAVDGSKREFWESEKIDARTVEGTDKTIYQQIINEYGEDSDEARVEVYGDFPKSGQDQFIAPHLVDDAMKRALHKDMTAPIIIGVDPARGGMDSTVIAVRQGRDIVAIKRFRGDDTMTTVGHVIDAIAPDGWFFLYEGIGNRKTNADLIKHGVMEIQVARFTLSDGGSAVLARLI